MALDRVLQIVLGFGLQAFSMDADKDKLFVLRLLLALGGWYA